MAVMKNTRGEGRDTIGVVILTYHRSHSLRLAIDSVLAQTYAADEILVSDCGSAAEMMALAASYRRVTLITQRDGDRSSARNAAILATQCEWVAFLDADDWYSSGMLAALVRMLRNRPDADLIYTSFYRVDGTDHICGASHRNHKLPKDPLIALANDNFIHPSTVMVRRQVLLDAGLFDESIQWAEDLDLWLRLAAREIQMAFVPGPLVYVTERPVTLTSDMPEAVAVSERGILDVLRRRSYCFRGVRDDDWRPWWLAGAHYRLGRVYWQAGESRRAAAEFRAALACDPQHRGAHLYHWATRHPSAAMLLRTWVAAKSALNRRLQRSH